MRFQGKEEEGFALVAALLAIMVLTAVGMLVFTMSTQDIRISGRLVGEKKALSAADAGAHWLSTHFDPFNLAPVANTPVEPNSDSRFSIETPTRPASGTALLPMSGYSQSGGQQWGQARYNAPITGSNTTYRSSVQVNLGLGYGPVEMTTTYR